GAARAPSRSQAAPDRPAADQQDQAGGRGVRRDRDGGSRQAGARPRRGAGEERQAPRPLHPGQHRRRGAEGRHPAARGRRFHPPLPRRVQAADSRPDVHPPADEHPAPHFALLGEIAKRCGLTQLSMGMSGDYELAIRMGATHVRVGTAIFGVREAKA
ncbi:MAG: hypothetical protein HC861_07885, partial [Rhodospirillaceae bacterium]|nr:hypothetical protein [Rhodospirillaceae bacterium]